MVEMPEEARRLIHEKLEKEDLDFDGCHFPSINMGGLKFRRAATFRKATFHGGTSFAGSTFFKGASFSRAKFLGPVSFTRVKFSGRATFSKAEFEDKALFSGAKFRGLCSQMLLLKGKNRFFWHNL